MTKKIITKTKIMMKKMTLTQREREREREREINKTNQLNIKARRHPRESSDMTDH